jgi:hypothetical protein
MSYSCFSYGEACFSWDWFHFNVLFDHALDPVHTQLLQERYSYVLCIAIGFCLKIIIQLTKAAADLFSASGAPWGLDSVGMADILGPNCGDTHLYKIQKNFLVTSKESTIEARARSLVFNSALDMVKVMELFYSIKMEFFILFCNLNVFLKIKRL